MRSAQWFRSRWILSGAVLAVFCSAGVLAQQPDHHSREWLRHVRIGAYSLTPENGKQIVREAEASGVYGIEVDNDIPGRYESLLHPAAKLEAIRRVAAEAHAHGNKAFVYIAGLECISQDGPHTLGKDHPDWLQRKMTGQPAIFGSKAAFWIQPGEEDAWVSPYAPGWRKLYMERVRQIASTGIDGIYVDIPYWMTHYTGWVKSWASFDNYTVAAFRKQTGLNARTDIRLGDPEDPGFRKWIDFRIETIDDFLAEIRRNATEVNPKIAVIPEIYPGIEESAPRVGVDVYQLYPEMDAIAHEYEFGDSPDHTAAARTPFNWFMYQIGMRSFRAFAGPEKPTWMLNYSWDGEKQVKPSAAMLTMLDSELMAGANVWDAQGHVMSGSNDMATRTAVFHWIARNEDIFGAVRQPEGETGVYFSDRTRNYYPAEFVPAYRGVLLMLLQNHVQFRIVTPRTVAQFHGKVLVLPDVRVLSDEEMAELTAFSSHGGRLVLTGKTDSRLYAIGGAVRFPKSPEVEYLARAKKDFAAADPGSEPEFLRAIRTETDVRVEASKNVVAHEALIGGRTCVFLANFSGLVADQNETPTPQRDIRISAAAGLGATLHLLPFMGKETVVQGRKTASGYEFTLPELKRGAVVWFR